MPDYIPQTDSGLRDFAMNFNTRIQLDPAAYSLTLPQAADYQAMYDAYLASYNAVNSPFSNSKAATTTKNNNRTALIALTRELVNIIQAAPTTDDTMRAELGIPIRDYEPTPIGPPETKPALQILSKDGTTVTIKITDTGSVNRGKPEGVARAMIFQHVGSEAPVSIKDWQFARTATKINSVEVNFPDDTAPGSRVWMTAYWMNPTDETGPTADPLSTNLPGGLSMAA